MFLYIFLVIAVLLIVKPTVNALFLSELGPEQLPFGYLLVALGAIASSLLYSRLLLKYKLKPLITLTLVFSSIILIGAAVLLFLGQLKGWMLYFFYAWVAVYGVLSASQFWVLANLVFNVRDAKRLFGFIGSGAILGGLFGGYLTSLFAPVFGNEFMIVLAAIMLISLLPLLNNIWRAKIEDSNTFQNDQTPRNIRNPFQLVRKSKHLTNLAFIVGISVLVAKLVDYLFSDYASSSISDPDELSSFFGFWFSTFNLISLGIQLFLTHRIVGVWGVGFSLLLLPLSILFGSVFFLFIPGLYAVVAIKAMDGILKQSINKSAFELLALPLPFNLKSRTKSFIDVVVDSLATGIAGLALVFLIKGFEWQGHQIAWLVIALVSIWALLIFKVRNSYYETFRNNLKGISDSNTTSSLERGKKIAVVDGMRSVFRNGSEKQILFMLDKLMEINDQRFSDDVRNLLDHPSTDVKIAAIKNLYFLDSTSMPSNINTLLEIKDENLNLAVMDFLLLHSRKEPDAIFNQFLDHPDTKISQAALFSLAKESVSNQALGQRYGLERRLRESLSNPTENHSPLLLKAIGVSRIKKFFPSLMDALLLEEITTKLVVIEAMGLSGDRAFVKYLLELLPKKELRKEAIDALKNFGPGILPNLVTMVKERKISIETCRFVPKVIEAFSNQDAVTYLFQLFNDVDLSVRLEVVRSMSNLRSLNPEIRFNRFKVVNRIFEECRLYHQTLAAMHTQIIISFRNRKKSKLEVLQDERDARASLLELLERRLDAGLERIFKLLGLKYPQEDVLLAYDLLLENEEERSRAIDFLDNLLTGNLKQQVFPIIDQMPTDFTTEEAVQRIKPKIPSEQECFVLLLQIPDVKLQLAVLYLIGKQGDVKYLSILQKLAADENYKIKTFAQDALKSIQKISPS